MIRKYIDRIIEKDNKEHMWHLADMLTDALYDLKSYNKDRYHEYKNKIKGMAYDYEIDEEMAREIVKDMEPLGEQWNMETLSQLLANDTHKLCDMYVVMNALANDYKDIIPLAQRDTYIKMAHAWIDDVDGRDHKVWWYFVK